MVENGNSVKFRKRLGGKIFGKGRVTFIETWLGVKIFFSFFWGGEQSPAPVPLPHSYFEVVNTVNQPSWPAARSGGTDIFAKKLAFSLSQVGQ